MYCRSCGSQIPTGVKFCRQCGKKTELAQAAGAAVPGTAVTPPLPAACTPADEKCLNCGAPRHSGSKFCRNCGASRTGEVQKVAQPQPARKPSSYAQPRLTRPPAGKPTPSSNSGMKALIGGSIFVLLALVATGLWYWKTHDENRAQQANSQPSASATPTPLSESPSPTPAETAPTQSTGANAPSSADTQPVPQSNAPASAAKERIPGGPSSRGANETSPSRKTGTAANLPSQAAPAFQQAHANAERAFAAAQYIDPPSESALYWARTAGAKGDPAANQIEAQVLEKMLSTVQAERSSRDYDSAIMLASRLMQLFPERADLRQLGSSLGDERQAYTRQQEEQRKAAEAKAATKEFPLRHRHVMGLQGFQPVYGFCEGMLRITPDGVARFDCTRCDARGHCHHLVFSAADIKDIQLKNDGTLHLAARSGNFDFLGDNAATQGVAASLHALSGK
jgi:cytoskeletal protein RodZ